MACRCCGSPSGCTFVVVIVVGVGSRVAVSVRPFGAGIDTARYGTLYCSGE